MTDKVIALDTTRAAIEAALDVALDQLAVCELLPHRTLAQQLARQDWIEIMRRRVSTLQAQLNAWDGGTAQ
jgi:hypothetical protein